MNPIMMFVRRILVPALMTITLLVPTAHAQSDQVTLSTSSPCFAPGDTASFTLSNGRTSTIYMPHAPVWRIFAVPSGSQVAPTFVFTSIVSLNGNSAKTYTWDETDYDGNPVPPGQYWVEIRYSLQFNPWVLRTVTAAFQIQENCPPVAGDPATWGQVKRRFR